HLCPLLSFSSPRPPRDLHSFPTRRSSDLVQLEPSGQNLGIVEVDSLARSADHKWAVFSADRFYLYSSDTDSLTGIPLRLSVSERSEEHTSELQSRFDLVCRLLLEKKKHQR